MVGIRDMDELLALNDLNGPDLAAGDRPSGLVAEECRVFFLACDGGIVESSPPTLLGSFGC